MIDLNEFKLDFRFFPNILKQEYYKLFQTKYLKDIKENNFLKKQYSETDYFVENLIKYRKEIGKDFF